MKHKARFITVEGVEGVGKTTNLKVIQAYFKQQQIPTLLTREPGGTPLAETIRTLLLEEKSEPILAMTELLLMFAARAQHVEQVIKPALARGEWVICDRFTDSTYAYQGAGRGLSSEQISALEQLVLDGFEPDLTILLDLPVEKGLARAALRSAKDRFEQEESAFFTRVRELFLQRAAANPARYRVVDTSQAPEMVQNRIEDILEVYISSN